MIMNKLPKNCGTKNQLGVTLVELMVVVAILGTIGILAAPNLATFFDRNRASSTANELLSSLALARAEAIRRGQRTIVKPNVSGDWSKGWKVFVDVGTADCSYGGSDLLVTAQPPFNEKVTFDSSFTATYIGFSAIGESRQNSSCDASHLDTAAANLSIKLTSGSADRYVCLGGIGRARVSATSC
jgi:type IV fimbrial biogenesis protein FimT